MPLSQRLAMTDYPDRETYLKASYWAVYKRRPDVKNRQRDRMLRRKYGISLADYEALWVAQGGRCAICWLSSDESPTAREGDLHVDHDHDTGVVRGLLCAGCNLALGRFGTQERLLAAFAYLGGVRHPA